MSFFPANSTVGCCGESISRSDRNSDRARSSASSEAIVCGMGIGVWTTAEARKSYSAKELGL